MLYYFIYTVRSKAPHESLADIGYAYKFRAFWRNYENDSWR